MSTPRGHRGERQPSPTSMTSGILNYAAMGGLHRPSIDHYWHAHADAQHRYDGDLHRGQPPCRNAAGSAGRAALLGRYGTAMPPHEKRAAVSSPPSTTGVPPESWTFSVTRHASSWTSSATPDPAGRLSSLVPSRLPPRDRADRGECREFLGLRHRRYAWPAMPQPPTSNSTPASCEQVRLAGPSRRRRPGTRPRLSPPAARSRTYSRRWPRTVSSSRRRRCTRRREHAPSSAVRLLGLPRRRSTLPGNAYCWISKNPRIHCDFRGSTRATGREKTNCEMLPKRS
jgi:hypothetical protein